MYRDERIAAAVSAARRLDIGVVMERILVAFDSLEPSLGAGIHAINLAKRISAKLFVLWVDSPGDGSPGAPVRPVARGMTKRRLEKLIDEGRSDGVSIDYFLTEGAFVGEVIKFIKQNNIGLLLVGSPGNSGDDSAAAGFAESLENIRLRVSCQIEVVHEKGPVSGAERK
jgi:nucleotide-binding universal stress UspA family protein